MSFMCNNIKTKKEEKSYIKTLDIKQCLNNLINRHRSFCLKQTNLKKKHSKGKIFYFTTDTF